MLKELKTMLRSTVNDIDINNLSNFKYILIRSIAVSSMFLVPVIYMLMHM